MKPLALPIVVALVLALGAGRAAAATAVEELLSLVPADTGLCFVLHDLRGHAAALGRSDFFKHFLAGPLGQALAQDPEFKKLAGVDAFLQKQLGIAWPRLRDDILGDALVFSYRPGPPGKMEQEEQALVLLKARDAKLLADLVDRLNQAQKEAGELRALEAREYQGQKYFRREEKPRSTYYYLKGPLLVFSWQEETLRRCIDRDQLGHIVSPVAERLRAAGANSRLAALLVNPRAFDADLEQRFSAAKGEEAGVLQVLRSYWKAVDGIVFSMGFDKEAELSVTIQAQPDKLPAAARRFLAEAAKPSELWSRFPAEPLFAVAGRLDFSALVDALSEFLPRAARDQARTDMDRNFGAMLGKDLFKEVLPALGPDFGLCVTAPPSDSKDWFPHAVWALRIRSENKIDQAILSGVQTLAQLAVLGYNQKNADRLSLKSVAHGTVEVKYLDNDRLFPPGLQPAFALQNGYLVLASSPDAMRRFGSVEPTNLVGEEMPLLRISFKAWRKYLQERREPIIAYLAEKDKITKEEARQRLEQVQSNLHYLDRIELSQRSTAGQATIILRVKPAWALK